MKKCNSIKFYYFMRKYKLEIYNKPDNEFKKILISKILK